MRYGRGKLFLSTGAFFEGYFKDGVFLRGKYYFTNGNTYEGEYYEGKFHGKGLYQWSDGEHYNGTWKMDKREG